MHSGEACCSRGQPSHSTGKLHTACLGQTTFSQFQCRQILSQVRTRGLPQDTVPLPANILRGDSCGEISEFQNKSDNVIVQTVNVAGRSQMLRPGWAQHTVFCSYTVILNKLRQKRSHGGSPACASPMRTTLDKDRHVSATLLQC